MQGFSERQTKNKKKTQKKPRKNEIAILTDTIPGRDGCLHLEQNLFTEWSKSIYKVDLLT